MIEETRPVQLSSDDGFILIRRYSDGDEGTLSFIDEQKTFSSRKLSNEEEEHADCFHVSHLV